MKDKEILEQISKYKSLMDLHEFLKEQQTLIEKLKQFSKARCKSDYNIENFTCYKCRASKKCKWAWDDYSTNGDCLNR